MRADARRAEHFFAHRLELGFGYVDVGDLETDVMLPAERVLGKEAMDGRVGAQRLDQLDLGVGRVDETHTDALRGQVERRMDGCCAHHVAPMRDAGVDRGRGDTDVVEATEVH